MGKLKRWIGDGGGMDWGWRRVGSWRDMCAPSESEGRARVYDIFLGIHTSAYPRSSFGLARGNMAMIYNLPPQPLAQTSHPNLSPKPPTPTSFPVYQSLEKNDQKFLHHPIKNLTLYIDCSGSTGNNAAYWNYAARLIEKYDNIFFWDTN